MELKSYKIESVYSGSNHELSLFLYSEIAQISHRFGELTYVYDIQVSLNSIFFIS